VAWGNGQGSTSLPWQEVRAFALDQNELTEPAIFPDNSSGIMVEFDLNRFRDRQKVPVIKVNERKKQIRVPVQSEREGFTGKYKTYVFEDRKFKRDEK
jgi:hypothetical protein